MLNMLIRPMAWGVVSAPHSVLRDLRDLFVCVFLLSGNYQSAAATFVALLYLPK